LIECGHRDPAAYTPRRIIAFVELHHAARRARMGDDLSLLRLAMHGEAKAVKAQLKDLKKG
jgi:hypothetical protein